MGVAGGLMLLIVGAVLAFAVRAHPGGLNLQLVGWILLLAGLFSIGFTLWRMDATKRRRIVYVRRGRDAPVSYRRTGIGERVTQPSGREAAVREVVTEESAFDPRVTGEPVVEPVVDEIEERGPGLGEPPIL